MSLPHCGIVSYGTDNALEYLPLEELRAKVQILDVSATVQLTQLYSNEADLPTRRAKYMFPVPAGAAITAFEVRVSDGTHLVGECMEREKAQREYRERVSAGRTAGLLDYVTDDIFAISIGSIPAHETVETNLTYVTSTMNDDILNSVRFTLPTYVGQRYGTPPADLLDASEPIQKTRIRISVDIQMSGILTLVETPGYDDLVTQYRSSQEGERVSRRRATLKLKSKSYLSRNFIVTIQAEKLDRPRCFAEMLEDDRYYTLAIQLTLIPKYDLPRIARQEFLLVIDRSGSMQGEPLEAAKKTAAVLLRLLPKEGTMFNIFAFDNEPTAFRTAESILFDASTLAQATSFISTIQSGGGTEMAKCLQRVLESKRRDIPTSVLLLTDGEVFNDLNESVQLIREAMQQTSPDARLMVSALGVGHQVSTDAVDAIAREGHGLALYSREAFDIVGGMRRLLVAGRSETIQDVSVDWGIRSDYLISERRAQRMSILPVQQSPPTIKRLHAEDRFYVYAIITLRRRFVPDHVTIRGQDKRGGAFSLKIPVRAVHLPGGDANLHALTAWKIIQDHQEERSLVPLGLREPIENTRKAAVVRLGEKYQVASKQTSFVALESERVTRALQRPGTPPVVSASASVARTGSRGSETSQAAGFLNLLSTFIFGPTSINTSPPGVPGTYPPSRTHSGRSRDNDTTDESGAEEDDDDAQSIESFSTMSSLNDNSDWSDWSDEESRSRPRMTREARQRARSRSPQTRTMSSAPANIQSAQGARPQINHIATAPTVDEKVYDLLEMSNFDGSFDLDAATRFVPPEVVEARPAHCDEILWATAVSVAYMLLKLGTGDAKDLLEKSLEFLNGNQDGNVLLLQAQSLLAQQNI